MRALSLTQPWASLVISGEKRIETRGWQIGYRGPIAIHASKGMPDWARAAAIEFGFEPDELPRGAVLGAVQVTDCRLVDEIVDSITEQEKAYGDYRLGRYAWILAEPEEFPEPIPAKGALGIWDWRQPGSARP